MPLTGQSLKIGSQGDEVKLLHVYLQQLGFPIDPKERDAAQYGKNTVRAVSEFQTKRGLQPTGAVDAATAEAINAVVEQLQPTPEPQPIAAPKPEPKAPTLTVEGHVRSADGSPLSGITVRAFDADLPSLGQDQPLGQPVATDDGGFYRISYTADQFSRAEKDTADLRVHAFDGKGSEIARSAVLFNAPAEATVDLVVAGDGKALSEYERLLATVTPLLGKIAIADLTDQDQAFLTGETGFNALFIANFVTAYQHARLTGLDAAEFYGLMREGLPTELTALLAQRQDVQRETLKRAIADNIIPAELGAKLDQIAANLTALRAKFSLQLPGQAAPSALGAILSTALPSVDRQTSFLMLYHNHQGDIEEFWQKLREHPDFKDGGQVEQLQFTLQLSALTGDNVGLVQALRQDGNVTSTPDLTKLNVAAWTKLVKTTAGDKAGNIPPYIKGATPEEKVSHYAHHIVETLKSAFPTKYVHLGITQQPDIDLGLVKQLFELNPDLDPQQPLPDTINWGGMTEPVRTKATEALAGLRGELKMFPKFDYKAALLTSPGDGKVVGLQNPIRQGVARFLDNASDFEFGQTHIDTYIAERGALAFQGIEESQKAAVTNQLKALQRVYQVVPRYEAMSSLMSQGLDSAQAIASVPEEVFVKHLGQQMGGEFYARVIFESAVDMRDLALVAYGNATEIARGAGPYAIGAPSPSIRSMAAYADLFGRFDLCDCEHCRSVYSPAAYFVDLLEFLNPKTGFWFPGTKPLDFLLRRRPDLQHIQLTCENTNTTIPYIDLVNEVLETYVAVHSTLDPRITNDTTPVTSAELMANPQHVNATAYGALKQAVYPMPLPFNRDLEVMRAYLNHLGASRYEVMRTFQRNAAAHDSESARECEYLNISPEERDALTGGAAQRLYGYSDGQHDWQELLASVQEFLKRTGLSYADLTELLKTRFINPAADLRSPSAIVIFAATERCDPAERRLRHQDGSPLSFEEWDRLQRFLRLWRKLGWRMLDVDRMLTALRVDTARLVNEDFLIKLGQAVRLQRDLNLPLSDALSFWNNIDTNGDDIETRRENSLYARLFQNRNLAVPAPDTFTLNADGSELNTPGHISDVEPAILAALRISAADLAIVRNATGLEDHPPALAPLTLANLSTLYRYAVLARALHLPVKDLIALRQVTGMDPFSVIVAPDGTRAFEPRLTIQFVEKVEKVRQSGFSVAQMNYLYRHVSEPAGGVALQQGEIASRLTTIRSGLEKIAADAGAPGPVEELLRKELAAVMDSANVDAVLKLLNGTAVYSATLPALPAGVSFPQPPHPGISYDSVGHQLRYVGAMTTRDRDVLAALAPATAVDYQQALGNVFSQPRALISRQMDKFLDAGAETQLIEDATATVQAKYAYVLDRLLPYLSRSLVIQTLSEALALDSATAETLLTTILQSRAIFGKTLIEDFLALRDGALLASYFDSADWSGVPVTRVDSTIDFTGVQDWPDPALVSAPAPARVKERFSVQWKGKLLALYDETYSFYVRADGRVRLFLNDEMLFDEPGTHDPEVHASRPLRAGQLYDIKLEYVHTTGTAVAQLQWESPSTPKAIIPRGQLYPPSAFNAYTLLHKASLLINGFKMTPKEISYLSSHGWDFTGVNPVSGSIRIPFDFNTLPLEFSDPFGLNATHFSQWEELYDLFTLRDALPPGEASLIDVFDAASAPSTSLRQATIDKLKAATNWDAGSLSDLTGSEGFNLTDAYLKNEITLRQVAACLQLSKRLGASVRQLFAWAENAPNANQAQEAKNVVRAKYEEAQWLTIAKGLNDGLREKQRSALVAYVLTWPAIVAAGVHDSNQLFEYFLIDVDMSACMATSRIKQAISSVQLFIQRCFMNLEIGVTPSTLSAKQWKWMKNYRVWEANRKIFLYPENWIEPELRDDKSPLFQELENELLQNEVTQDTAETAFLNYLEKLDEVARLDIRGMYWECESETTAIWEDPQASDGGVAPEERADILHVFGRTQSTPPVYYYRKLVNRRTWTPWEKLQVAIEGDHLIPVVYNRRLYLFWPIFTEKQEAPPRQPDSGTAHAGTAHSGTAALDISPITNQPPKHLQIEIAWSENKNGKWSAKKASPGKIDVASAFDVPPENRPNCFFGTSEDNGDLVINCWYQSGPGRDILALGIFTFSGCDGRAAANSNSSYTAIPSADDFFPPESDVVNQTFESNEDGSSLSLFSSFDAHRFRIDALAPLRRPGEDRFRILYPHQYFPYTIQAPFFYQDGQRTYFVAPERAVDVASQLVDPNRVTIQREQMNVTASQKTFAPSTATKLVGSNQNVAPIWNQMTICPGDRSLDDVGATSTPARQPATQLRFSTFFHPHVCAFIKALKRTGIPGLLSLENQQRSDFPRNAFEEIYNPTIFIDANYPKEDVDFEGGAYSLYNWELFFHTPLLIAARLSKNQRFEEARQWFHYVFDPTDDSDDHVPRRFWKVLPFYLNDHVAQDQIGELLRLLSYRGNDAATLARKAAVQDQVDQWKDDPFNPHLIARLRITAYQKTVVMKYIDNLIAWGDQLFRQDTIESINEATQLYVLAYLMLGPRPEVIPPREKAPPGTYALLRPDLDRFSNALVATENAIAPRRCAPLRPRGNPGTPGGASLGTTFYFCIPPNDKLLGYWDLVADRLFKIRHCMNIEGTVRQLPLFEPPIDPALLVRARALGLDLSTVLGDTNVALPAYRFNSMVQKALELCGEVKSLGAALLSALEKRDAEDLTRLRSGHEISLLEAVRTLKEKQIEEAKDTWEGLQKSEEVVTIRRDYYAGLLSTLLGLNPGEIVQLALATQSLGVQEAQANMDLLANILHLIPNIKVGVPVTMGATFGGHNLGDALHAFSTFMGAQASIMNSAGSMSATLAGYQRRADEWRHQETLANKELEQIAKQIAAADIRRSIAEKDLENHDKQIENAKAIDEYMRSKFTNRELYDWMASQVSALYFQTYQLAYDIAKRAEKAYRFERGLPTSNFIQFGYWDSLKKGLLAGERLHLDLKRLEMAYLDQNRREYEIARNISLLGLDPLELVRLRETGTCEFELPEELFDLDYPGHYMRRIKSVSLTIPCVVGPYTNINCTLTLLSNKTRIKNTRSTNSSTPYSEIEDDDRFVANFAAVQSIATSHAQNDSGLFELNFRDERYVPFECAGAISRWRIEMPRECNRFDFNTIPDVIFHLKYTSRDGGETLKNDAMREVVNPTPPHPLTGTRLFSARHEFASEWYRFMNPPIETPGQILELRLTRDHFPFIAQARTLGISRIDLFLLIKDRQIYEGPLSPYAHAAVKMAISPPEALDAADAAGARDLSRNATFGSVPYRSVVLAGQSLPVNLSLKTSEADIQPIATELKSTVTVGSTTRTRLRADAIEDILVACHYSAT
jgi:hypothetical protein